MSREGASRTEARRKGISAVPLAAVLAGILCGCVMAVLIRTNEETRRSDAWAAPLLSMQEALQEEQTRLMLEIAGLESAAAAYAAGYSGAAIVRLRAEWEDVRPYAGLTDVTGPGVEIVLDDAPRESIRPEDDINLYIVHDVDVLRVVNLLRGAGAEAISINGERLLANSRIRCGGPTIRVRDQSLAPPFVIRAIGDPQSLSGALSSQGDGGMSELDILRFFGVRVEVSIKEAVEVPRYIGNLTFTYAEEAG